ncbi:Iron-sulfur cluster assembly 1-like, mitochondrial [Hondaea fermentalgiana]|uniref:Iron-sulfur cluster assembly 1-like, mitochondrial n=1 Tax=Hondaea fermentalgiana TaxID=2315210 RepID=A0A2R5GQ40_9STRA|nr:Iron-sulfur cluster assembly 1-like, mitochondrial [Hondaea fermentalgiana]|eukprot:GBG32996.1 Iron-sulfur cluster assembly 1-like, mitochondrial [Hondaea fermentalgiana]
MLKEAQRLQEENEMRSKAEEPRKVILSKTSLRAVEGGACDFYTVRLSHPPEADVMVQIEDASGQVRASPKVVRFSFDATEPGMQGHWATPQKVRVMAVDDDSIEAMRETASLEHCALSGDLRFSSVNGRCLVEPSHLPVDIVDNDGGFVFSFGEVDGVRSHHPVAQSLRSSDVERRMSNSSAAVNLALRSSRHSHTSSLRERGPLSTTSESGRIPEMSVRSVGCGRSHMAVVLADGRVFTAGAGGQGQLGHGDFLQRVELTPWRSIDRDGILRSKITQVACGAAHTALVTDDGRLLMCGSNQEGQLDRGVVKCRIFGWGDSSSGALGCGVSGQVRHPMELRDLDAEDPFQISCGSRHTAVLCGEGRLYTAGWGIHGCMGRRRAEDDEHLNYFDLVTTARRGVQSPTFVDIASGHSHLAALADTNEVYICGENECGQLGVGDRIHRSLLTHVGFLSGLGVASLACGMFHTAAITWEGSLYVWGSNDNGQLGLGAHVLHQTVPTLHGTVTGEVKQVHAGHAHTVVVMHKGLENPSPVRAPAAAEAPKKRSRMRKLPDAITLTDAAVARIKKLLARRPEAAGVRLGVKRKGCNGLSYTLDYADKFTFEDTVSKDGVTVGIDPKSLIYLVGCEMDYVEDELAAEFRFENPNSKGNCGCGESFNV